MDPEHKRTEKCLLLEKLKTQAGVVSCFLLERKDSGKPGVRKLERHRSDISIDIVTDVKTLDIGDNVTDP